MARKWNVRLQHAATPMRAVALSCGLLPAAALAVHAPRPRAAAGDSATRVEARVTSDTAKTKYPIVLVHGLLGFDNLLGVDYFYDIPGRLAAAGAKGSVASVTSVGGANGGSKVADLLAKLPEGGIGQTLVVKAVGLLTGLIGFLSGKDPSQRKRSINHALASPAQRPAYAAARSMFQGSSAS